MRHTGYVAGDRAAAAGCFADGSPSLPSVAAFYSMTVSASNAFSARSCPVTFFFRIGALFILRTPYVEIDCGLVSVGPLQCVLSSQNGIYPDKLFIGTPSADFSENRS